jgi:predicted ATP-dependent protease
VLNATDLLTNPAIWDTLKRVIRHGEGFIEDMGEQYSLLPTSGLKPESMPIDVKLIVIGNDYIYHSLYHQDEDFSKIFKIKADFDYKMTRNKKNIRSYTKFIAKRCEQEDLRPFDRAAVSAFIEFGSRLVDNQSMLSTQFGQLKDLSIEADFVAGLQDSKTVKRSHVEDALEKKFHRHNLYEAQLLEMIKEDSILLSITGKTIGQVNGLTVLDLGDYSFGKPCRLTAVSNFSDDGIFNIERAVRLSGKIHDKGMYILTGFLNSLLCRKYKIGFSASVCFEQSYGMIDGDSASITELTAILSSLAEIPVFQNLAMTGSVNQFGEVQPVGGVNEKIEGFFKVTRLLGKKGPFTIMLPHQNAIDLMLHKDIQEAVKKGMFNIIPVKYFWQVFEIATGVPLGLKTLREKTYSPGSALEKIEKKVNAMELTAVKREKKLQDSVKSK